MANHMKRVGTIFALTWVIVLVCFGRGLAQSNDEGGIVVENEPNVTSTPVFIGSTVNLTFMIFVTGKNNRMIFTLVPKDDSYFKVAFNELQFDSQEEAGNSVGQEMVVNITGIKLIISELTLVAVNQNGERSIILTHYVKVKRVPNKVALIVRYVVTAAVIGSIWLMGVTTDYKLIVTIIKRPYPLIIGILCQFIIMPFFAWSLAKIFQIKGAAGVGLVLDGSCPGGTNSNLFSILLDVDYVLSITMTCASIIIALGMMPLNLLIYGSAFVAAGEIIRTPFLDIVIQILFLVIPLCIGIFLGWRFPKLKVFAEKYIKPFSAVVLVVLIMTDLPFNLFIFDSPWQYYVVSIIFPLIGGLAGFTISMLLRLTKRRSLTVALETGIQNALLAAAVLTFSYPQPESDLATRIPYLILIFTTLDGLALSLIYNLLKKFYWHGVPFDDDITDHVKTVDNENRTKTKANEISTVSSNVLVSTENVDCQADLGPDSLTNSGQVNTAFSS